MPLRRMLRLVVITSTFFTCIFLFSKSSPAFMQDDLSAKLPEGEGKGYVMTLCTSCHGLGNILAQKKSAAGWQATVATMLGRISPGMDQETEIISKYLAEHFGTTPAPSSGSATATGAPSTSQGRIGVSHQVLFNFKPEVSEEKRKEILDSGRTVLSSIPEALSVVVGKLVQKDSEFQYGLFVGLKNEADLQTYRSNPSHQKWLESTFRPAVAKSAVTDIVE